MVKILDLASGGVLINVWGAATLIGSGESPRMTALRSSQKSFRYTGRAWMLSASSTKFSS
jgi:hypothetical protein